MNYRPTLPSFIALSLTAFSSLGCIPASWADAEPDALFASDDVLEVRISTQLSTLLEERPFDTELPATLELRGDAAPTQSFDIQVRTRGRYRRRHDICLFPPLRLNFKTSTVADTVFHKQDKLKLVTHCNRQSRFEQSVLREFAAYRILNLLTDTSFRVRLMQITYVDSEAKHDDITRYGFVIEHRKRLAKRLGVEVLEIPKTQVAALDARHTNLVSVFHYLIGNTDFSPIRGAPDEPCCHNHVLFGGNGEKLLSVPYDFDQSGLVSAPYAAPNPRFGLRNVRQRLYRGRCDNNPHIAATLATLRERQASVLATIDSIPSLEKTPKRAMTKYVGHFFKRFATDKSVERTFVDNCV